MKNTNPTRFKALFVLAMGFLLLLFNGGSRFTMGLTLKPMADDLEWSRATLSLTVTVFMLVSALVLPAIGRLVDRYSIRGILLVSVAVSSVSLALMGVMQTPLQAILLYGVLFALSNAGTSIAPVGILISRWFPERLGLANSIAISGMGVGQLVIILLLTAQLEVIGWRGAFVLLAGLGLLLLLPLAFLSAPREAEPETLDHSTSAERADSAVSVSSALRTRTLWGLIAIYAVCGFQDFFIATHVVAFARDHGFAPAMAGNLFALMGLFGLVGVLATGFLSDRYGPVVPTLVCFAIRIILFGLIMLTRSPTVIILFALVYGITFWITAPLTVVFVRQHFGVRHLGVLSGIIIMVHQAAGGLGAYMGGAAFDALGSYHVVFQLMLVLSVAALWLTWWVSRIHKGSLH